MKQQDLNYWLTHIESFNVNEIELGLERIKTVALRLDIVKQAAKIITVAGTNGKGSCVAGIESLALISDISVGCYTSPHLLKFNERIRVDGEMIDDISLINAFELIETVREGTPLTFFEYTTLACLIIFKSKKLDLLVLEVGLGGRLDAVNIIDPDVAIVTTIDNDHESWLGTDLSQIAFEKSAIFRKNSINLVGDEKSMTLIDCVRSENDLSVQLVSEISRYEKVFSLLVLQLLDRSINPNYLISQNIQLSLVAFDSLFKINFHNFDLSIFIKKIKLNGRFQQLASNPITIVDVGHNPQAALNLVKNIVAQDTNGSRYAICGMMKDKAILSFLEPLTALIDHWFFVDLPIDRAAKGDDLLTYYQQINSKLTTVSSSSVKQATTEIAVSVAVAYQNILAQCKPNDQIYVFGSFITVAELLHYCDENW